MSCVHDERNGDADTTGFAEGQSWRRKNQRGPKPEKDKVRKKSNQKRAGKENDEEKTNDHKTAQKSN